jgi:UDP-N-acetylmuramoylalanine--D-glutamate ligase
MDLKKSPNIAVILNVTQDHLDYHKNREEYVDAKKPIVKYQTQDDFAVINTDYETSSEFIKETKAEVYEVSIQKYVEKGCYVSKDDEIVLRGKDVDEKITTFSSLKLRGRHNLENVCAAVAVSYIAQADIDSIKKAVKEFKGLEHRLEFVAEVGGVKYYNDSFATTPETTIAAINSFHESVILISGGSKKGSDYTQMGKVITEKVKTVFLIGETATEIKEKIFAVNPSIDLREGFTDMDDLVKRTSDIAKAGDVVVLSPGCASFGLFDNYKQRGELFKEAVKKLES